MSINPVHEFFDESNGDARCPVDGCAFSTKTRNPTNLINQLRKHKDRFADYEQNKSALDDLQKSQPKIPFLVEQKRSTQKANSGGQSALALLAGKRGRFLIVLSICLNSRTISNSSRRHAVIRCRAGKRCERKFSSPALQKKVKLAFGDTRSIANASDIYTAKGMGAS
jgi:hypothetical protein